MKKLLILMLVNIMAMSSSCFAVYSFSDNFDDGIIDSSFWNVSGDGVSESEGVLNITRDDAADNLSSINSFSGLFEITFDITPVYIGWQDVFHGISLMESDVAGDGSPSSDGISFGFYGDGDGDFCSSQNTPRMVSYYYADYYANFSAGVTYSFRLANDSDYIYLYVNNDLIFVRDFDYIDNFYVHFPGFPGIYVDGNGDAYSSGSTSGIDNFSITVTPIPEPATMALLSLGGLLLRRKK